MSHRHHHLDIPYFFVHFGGTAPVFLSRTSRDSTASFTMAMTCPLPHSHSTSHQIILPWFPQSLFLPHLSSVPLGLRVHRCHQARSLSVRISLIHFFFQS